MFSERFADSAGGPNPLWEARLAAEAAGKRILDLTGSNPTSSGIPYPSGIPALFDRPSVLAYRPDPKGVPEAREAVSAYYASRDRAIDPGDLILTASTSEAYAFLFKLLCDPGDEVLIPSPTYPLFDALAELEHVHLVRYPLRFADRWKADFRFLETILSTRTKALILVHPNNPTGHLADDEEIRAYLRLAADHGLALIVDEVFRDYILGDRRFESIESNGPLVFTLNGFSKTLGLPQMKLGWIHVGGARPAVQAALGHLEWIADAFLSVNTPVQTAAADLLKLAPAIQSGILERLRDNLRAAQDMLAGQRALRMLEPDAGWSLILEAEPLRDDETFALELIEKDGIYVHPGHLFGFEEGCRIVVSLLGPEAEFREGLARILARAGGMEHG
jgi:aspartate/methionine/tyrosine aminotransferase